MTLTLPSRLTAEWHPTRNGSLTPDQVTLKSKTRVWWLCEKNHEWERSVSGQVLSQKCPYCTGRYAIPGETDLKTLRPDVAVFWHPTRNGNLTPEQFTVRSSKKIWWQCDKGHEFYRQIFFQSSYPSCPYCTGRNAILGKTDLKTLKPEIAAQWHPTRNGNLTPEQVKVSSNRKVWWLCPENEDHEWETAINLRTRKNNPTGCPYCSKRKILPGDNDLNTLHPSVAAEWHPTKNGVLTPEQVPPSGKYRAWWLCGKGHEWETELQTRTASRGSSGCPTCFTSEPSQSEQELAEYIKTLVGEKNVITNSRQIISSNYELDVYIPSLKIAVEYNGIYWHSEAKKDTKTYHYDKWLACKDAGIQLYQIWEDDYKRNPELVKRILAYKLGVSDESRTFARKTTPAVLNRLEVQGFLNENHIQGYSSGSHYLGLKTRDNTLVAVMVLRKPSKESTEYTIVRYATNQSVIGGFTKLLSYAEKLYNPSRFITFSDNTISDGGLYGRNGFVADKEIPPDYMYIVRNQRKHKFGYRLKKFRTDPTLKYKEGLSETQLAKLNNLHRIWDAGKTRWVYVPKTVTDI